MKTDLRYEKKMVFESLGLSEVRSWVHTHPDAFHVAYPPRQVNNIYFDTIERSLLQEHIDGIAFRAKLRFRWYGRSWIAQEGQIEIKKKMGQVGYKITKPIMGTIDLTQNNWREIIQAIKNESKEEIISLFDTMSPALINQYQREYYESADKKVRVTLDYDIHAFAQSFGLSPNITFAQPTAKKVVIEVKVAKEHYQSLANALAAFPLRCLQNSKYLNAMEYAV